jgi:flagellar biosynthesis/type III secretory pathway chaperone
MTSSRANSLQRLSALIQDALELLRAELRPVLLEKQQALVANQLDELQQLSEHEQRLAARLAALEAERIAALGDVCRAHAINAEEGAALQLSELLPLLPPSDERSRLESAAADLQEEMMELGWINADNGYLTRNLLNYTEMVMRQVTRGNAKPRYGADGRVKEAAPERAMLDDRI